MYRTPEDRIVRHFPGGAAAEGEVECENEGGEEGAEGDADVEVGVVGVEAALVVLRVVVELGALDRREVLEVEGRALVTHPKNGIGCMSVTKTSFFDIKLF